MYPRLALESEDSLELPIILSAGLIDGATIAGLWFADQIQDFMHARQALYLWVSSSPCGLAFIIHCVLIS